MNIEWYNPLLGTPVVAFADYGLSLNPAAYKAIGEPDGVRLGFERLRRWIVIHPLSGSEEEIKQLGGLGVRTRHGAVRIHARDFTRFVHRYYPELRPGNRAVRYLAWYDEPDGLLIVDLNQPVETSRPVDAELVEDNETLESKNNNGGVVN